MEDGYEYILQLTLSENSYAKKNSQVFSSFGIDWIFEKFLTLIIFHLDRFNNLAAINKL